MNKIKVIKCPCCNSMKNATIEGTTDSGWGSLIIRSIGRVDLTVCVDCGCVYMSGRRFAWLKEKFEEKNDEQR